MKTNQSSAKTTVEGLEEIDVKSEHKVLGMKRICEKRYLLSQIIEHS